MHSQGSDPHGPIYYKGRYHLFFQACHSSCQWCVCFVVLCQCHKCACICCLFVSVFHECARCTDKCTILLFVVSPIITGFGGCTGSTLCQKTEFTGSDYPLPSLLRLVSDTRLAVLVVRISVLHVICELEMLDALTLDRLKTYSISHCYNLPPLRLAGRRRLLHRQPKDRPHNRLPHALLHWCVLHTVLLICRSKQTATDVPIETVLLFFSPFSSLHTSATPITLHRCTPATQPCSGISSPRPTVICVQPSDAPLGDATVCRGRPRCL